jgi:preprotein translocase subunit SecY
MFEKLRVVFTIPELRQKILLTLLLLAIYRVGWQVPLPIIDAERMAAQMSSQQGGLADLLRTVAVFSASQLNQATIFGLGIMPYISASIIFQLLATFWAPLEKLQKEGEVGRKKINQYTRIATVFLCFFQSWFYISYLASPGAGVSLLNPTIAPDGTLSWAWHFNAVLIMTAGTVFLMWLGEQIDEYGIGNGISLLIMANIIASLPGAITELVQNTTLELGGSGGGQQGIEVVLVLVILFFLVVMGVVLMTQGQRRIPTQSAKHVRGRRVYGGTRQYLPLRVNQAGVMPIIFASSLLLFPQMFFHWMEGKYPGNSFWHGLSDSFMRGSSFTYNLLFIGLIYFFCYFWTAITFNPKDMAENLKNFGTFIPGYRPGKRTADYLEKVMVRITYVGAGFLALVAITPTIISALLAVPTQIAYFYGGTGILIAVSVAFDLVQKIDSHLVMRNYRGLLERQ